MTSIESNTATVTAASDDGDIPDDFATHLFPDDAGTLPLVARKALVLLIKRTHIWSGTQPKLWQAIMDHQDMIGARLNDMFLELVLDESNGIAYKRQAGRDLGRMFTTLLHNSSYTRDEVALLLHFRTVHQRAVRDGDEAAYMDRDELIEHCAMYRPESVKDHTAADKAARSAVERLTRDGFLIEDTSDPDRLRVSPFVETVLTVERLPAFVDALWSGDLTGPDGDDATEQEGGADG